MNTQNFQQLDQEFGFDQGFAQWIHEVGVESKKISEEDSEEYGEVILKSGDEIYDVPVNYLNQIINS